MDVETQRAIAQAVADALATRESTLSLDTLVTVVVYVFTSGVVWGVFHMRLRNLEEGGRQLRADLQRLIEGRVQRLEDKFTRMRERLLASGALGLTEQDEDES